MAVRADDASTLQQGAHAISVTLFSDFLRNPPLDFFEVREGPGHPIFLHNRQRINLCTHSYKRKEYFPDSMGSVMKVNSMGDLESLSERLLKNPLFFDVFLERDAKVPYGRTRYITKGEFVVTVWPQHPAIRNKILTLLENARADLEAGRKFAIELNFTSAMKEWYKTLFTQDDEDHNGCYIYSMYDCKYARLCITNESEFADCYGCNLPESLVLWMICLPCCLLTCPCYRVHRCFSVVDHGGEIDATVGYQSLNSSQSSQDAVLLLVETMRREAAEERSNTQYVTTESPQQPVMQIQSGGAPQHWAPAGGQPGAPTSAPDLKTYPPQAHVTAQPGGAPQHWAPAGGQHGSPGAEAGYPIGIHMPPPGPPVHRTQPPPSEGMPPTYEESMRQQDSTSDQANLI